MSLLHAQTGDGGWRAELQKYLEEAVNMVTCGMNLMKWWQVHGLVHLDLNERLPGWVASLRWTSQTGAKYLCCMEVET